MLGVGFGDHCHRLAVAAGDRPGVGINDRQCPAPRLHLVAVDHTLGDLIAFEADGEDWSSFSR
jgi:hypothetical protein